MLGDDDWVTMWDRISGRMFRRFYFRHAMALAFSQDGGKLLISSGVGDNGIWDIATGERKKLLKEEFYGSGNIFAAFLRDGTRTLLCFHKDKCTYRELSADPYDEVSDSSGMMWRKPNLGVSVQLWKDPNRDYEALPLSPSEGTFSPYLYEAVSLAADELSVAIALGEKGVGWMDLRTDGRRRVIPIPDAEVNAVAALDRARVVAGLSNGDVQLIDAVSGDILRTLHTRETGIGAIVRLDDERIAVASHAPAAWVSDGRDDQRGEILIVSVEDLSVSERLVWNQPIGDESLPNEASANAYVNRLAASGDGRWLVSASQPVWWRNNENYIFVQVWDTVAARASLLGSRALPTERVAFGRDDDLLLVDSDAVASLWNLKDGRVTEQFRHPSGDTYVTLAADTVVYVPGDTDGSIRVWSGSFRRA